MRKRKSIVYLGSSGFPYGLAEVQKKILISKSLILSGNTVTVICTNGIHNKTQYPEFKESGRYEDIEYVYTSGSPFREEGFIKRNLLKVKGRINEVSLIRKRKKIDELDYAILSTNKFYSIVMYYFLSKAYRFKIILSYAEYYPGIKRKWFRAFGMFNEILYDRYAPLFVDAIFPISEFLIRHLKERYPKKKYLKIPVLTDVERYNDIEKLAGQKYFLFCGAANYKEIIKFIIDSFMLLDRGATFLYLVINGTENNMIEIKKYINDNPMRDKIKLVSRLTEKELYSYYKNAIALLIPLRPTLQDQARFPHKIGEYLASGNPVISTNYGEVKYYFKDMENMLIADNYDINLFAAKMQFVTDHSVEAQKIGINGKNMVLDIFDYRAHSNAINNFLNSDFNHE